MKNTAIAPTIRGGPKGLRNLERPTLLRPLPLLPVEGGLCRRTLGWHADPTVVSVVQGVPQTAAIDELDVHLLRSSSSSTSVCRFASRQ
jgi:hypothetical protein